MQGYDNLKPPGIRTTGLLLGLLTGILATLFDGIMLWKLAAVQTYVPREYPATLCVFNLLFWLVVGGISGNLLAWCVPEDRLEKNQNFYWTLFFLAPCTAAYGVLGSIPLPLINLKNIFMYWPRAAYDHHLSAFWVAGLFCFLLLKIKTSDPRVSCSPLLLGLETCIIMLLLHFCSNPSLWLPFHYESSSLLVDSLGMPLSLFNVIVYICGVAATLGFYALLFFKVRPLLCAWPLKRLSVLGTCLILFVCGILYWSWLLSHRTTPLTDAGALRSSPARADGYPDVLLIVLDALRADRLTVYDKNRSTSPNLDAFARDALVFDRCIAPTSWTVPSHASLFSGLYSSEHGCDYSVSRKQLSPLDDSCATLAEILQDNGYATAAVVSNVSMFYSLNLFQGFQYVDIRGNIGAQQGLPFRPLLLCFNYFTNMQPAFLKPYRTASYINDEILSLLEKTSSRPLFLFVNYMDVHSPNLAPSPYNNSFLNQTFPRLYGIRQYVNRARKRSDKNTWDAYIQSQYDAETAYLDDALGKLMTHLKTTGRYDASLIIITSDHGELLGENGLYEHRCALYEGVVRVPLMIKFPGSSQTGRVAKPINLTDVYATILSLCNLPVPESVSAEPFGGDASAVSEIYTDETGEHKAVYDGRYKYMEYIGAEGTALRKAELYDLSTDPNEEKNLVDAQPDVAGALRMKLQHWKDNRRKPVTRRDTVPLPDGVKEKLKALGYIH